MITRRNAILAAAPVGIAVGSILTAGGGRLRASDSAPSGSEAKHAMHMQHFARSIADCAVVCASCSDHCAALAVGGAKDHVRSQKFCADCADVCTAAAQIVARQGLLRAVIVDACAKACDLCAQQCAKFPDDAHMKACAKSCRDCVQTCRDLTEHIHTETN